MVTLHNSTTVLGSLAMATLIIISPSLCLNPPVEMGSVYNSWCARPSLGSSCFRTTALGERELPKICGNSYGLGTPGQALFAPSLTKTPTEFQQFVEQRRALSHNVVLDLRPVAHFRREHLVGATSMPVTELASRMLELPPPFDHPVSIVGSDEDLSTAREFLERKGWQVGEEVRPVGDADKGDFPGMPTEVGPHSVQGWRANDFLEFCMERFILPSAIGKSGSGSAGGESVWLDLGCGSGRDTVYMAQRLPPETRVVGVDNHSYALERGEELAKLWIEREDGLGGSADINDDLAVSIGQDSKSGGLVGSMGRVGAADDGQGHAAGIGSGIRGVVSRRCNWLCADLRKEGTLAGIKATVIHGHRFKCEQLLPFLRDEVLLSGGYFIWSTFLYTGTDNLVPPWRPSRMMRPGELSDIFLGEDFDVLVDEIGELPTRGSVVPANFFACRKRPVLP